MKRRLTLLALSTAIACAKPQTDPHANHAQTAVSLSAAEVHAGHDMAAMDMDGGMSPEGYSAVTIDPARADALQLATAVVEARDFKKELRTVGVVALDETRSAHVHAKVRGWIDGIHVNYMGQKVSAGQPLCSIYSQDVYAAELEFLSILDRTKNQLIPPGEFADAEQHAQQQLVDASRRRLGLWDVPKEEIARLESTREPHRTFTLAAPRAGVVVSKQAIEGMFVDPSVELYTLSDLSTVWVLADVYDADVPYVKLGDHARLTVEGVEGEVHGAVAFLAPTLDEATRTLKVRFVLANKDGRLRPGAFVHAVMNLAMGTGLAVPEQAVIRTGARAIVFVVHGEHGEHLQPREIKLGPLVGDQYRVESGLAAGERVAVGAQFLIDSESRLRATSGSGAGHVHH